MKAFILAAGFGERLRPITCHIPKPLLPILGKPVLEKVIERLVALPISKIGINMHYKWEMIRDWVNGSAYPDKIDLFLENDVLGTGGGLKNAESFLAGTDFIVHNSDIICDIDLKVLAEAHIRSGNTVTLATHGHTGLNNVWIDQSGMVKHVGDSPGGRSGLRPVAFTGIAVYSPRIFRFLPKGRSGVVEAWMRAAKEEQVGTLDFTGCSWIDIGSPEAYSSYIFETLQQNGEVIYVCPQIDLPGVRIGARTVVEKACTIAAGAVLNHCLVLPGSTVAADAKKENLIIGPDYEIPIKEPLAIPESLPSSLISRFMDDPDGGIKINLIGTGGSDRNYYRVSGGGKTAVLMECPGTDHDFQRHIIYTTFFRKWGIPVPGLLEADPGGINPVLTKKMHLYALFEDLGDMSLYSWLHCNRSPVKREEMYRRVLDIMIRLHTSVSAQVSECLLLKSRIFDYEHLLWESSYFFERFVVGLHKIEARDEKGLRHEFERLAALVESFPKTVLHRDFQSQNVLISEDLPRIIDYQGARMGPPGYDLASLLWDPYAELEEDLRSSLTGYYLERITGSNGLNKDVLYGTLLPCRIQRHMQALGAYAFLSDVKGKKFFLRHVPAALSHLDKETAALRDDYPLLRRLVETINEKTAH